MLKQTKNTSVIKFILAWLAADAAGHYEAGSGATELWNCGAVGLWNCANLDTYFPVISRPALS